VPVLLIDLVVVLSSITIIVSTITSTQLCLWWPAEQTNKQHHTNSRPSKGTALTSGC